MAVENTIYVATRGSTLALVQATVVLEQCRAAFPDLRFEIKIVKTTGDKLQTASLAEANLPKGLFTKELEQALLSGEASLAVHSLKDLPTELPEGLGVGAVTRRADVRDVLICRGAAIPANSGSGPDVEGLPPGATVATSSTRRRAQLLERRPDLNVVPIRGNVPTRLRKLCEQEEIGALVLAAAGLQRLGYEVRADGHLTSPGRLSLPERGLSLNLVSPLMAAYLPLSEMLPCVGQAAIGVEIRQDDEQAKVFCGRLNDPGTELCVRAERAFLRGLGGGCQLAVAALAEVTGDQIYMRCVSYLSGGARRTEGQGRATEPEKLGEELARKIAAA